MTRSTFLIALVTTFTKYARINELIMRELKRSKLEFAGTGLDTFQYKHTHVRFLPCVFLQFCIRIDMRNIQKIMIVRPGRREESFDSNDQQFNFSISRRVHKYNAQSLSTVIYCWFRDEFALDKTDVSIIPRICFKGHRFRIDLNDSVGNRDTIAKC